MAPSKTYKCPVFGRVHSYIMLFWGYILLISAVHGQQTIETLRLNTYQQGYLSPRLDIGCCGVEFGFCIVSVEDIKNGDELFRIPLEQHFRYDT